MKNIFIAFISILLITSSCKLKEDTTGTTDQSGSTDNTVTSSIKVVKPNGGESLSEGSSSEITWTGTGVVRIQFSVDNGSTWSLVADSLKATGVYTWFPVPNQISNQCRIRVSTVDGTSADASDQVFSIVRNSNKSLTISSPKKGDEWEAGNSKQIKWFSSGIDSVKIDYTTDNGNHWNLITVDKKNTGVYYWMQVPNTPSTLAKIRIMDAKGGVPSTESDIFSILPEPKLKVLSPNGGERVLAGTSRKIEWVSENIENVKLSYTTNNGFNWNTIADNIPSTGFYVWEPVPNINSQLCKVRVYDAKDGEPNDASDSTFTITNQITQTIEVTYPNGGEKWQAGTNQSITWRSSGIPQVKIDFTSNNGLTWNTIIDKLPNTGAYEWNVPNSISTQCLIKISDATDNDPVDQSNGLFRITPKPELKVLKPNGGESWTAGVLDTIKWSSVGVENVFIEYTPNNGNNWYTIVEKTPSSGIYLTSFTNPGTQYKVRIIDADNHSPQDESDGTFAVTPEPKINVIYPNGGEEFYPGSANNIKWTSTNIENVKIEYTTNNGASWSLITNSTPSDGVYSWDPVPNVSSLQCRIRVSDAKDGIPSDISDDNFTITTQGNQLIKVKSPNGKEEWAACSSQVIKWDASGIANVKIEYTVNNGINWITITSSTPSTGFYTWTPIPNIPSTNCKVRVSDAQDNSPSDESDEFFSIGAAASIKVITPNGNDTWLKGTNREIKWSSQDVANVKIEYTTNGGGSWNTIVNSTPSTGTYMWNNIPDANNSLQCRIRVSEAQYGIPSDISDDNFAIMSPGAQQVKVIAPNGSEEWSVGSMQNIIWDAGGIANVKIEYSTNNGLNWSTVVESTPSNGYYTWNPIPNTPATNCKIKISDAADGDPVDMSDNSFSILPKPTIKVVAPNGGESIQTGTTTEIRWTSENVAFVKIEYTTNGGAAWNVITNSTESTGSYLWTTVPNVNSLQCRIRISDASNGTSSDISDNNFQISNQVSQSIRVISPDGGERWQAGSPKNITWDSKAISNVKIEFTTNNGINWSTIVNSAASTGSYEWSIPSLNSTQCKVKVSDAVDGDPYDESNSTFTIKPLPALTILTPTNGTEIFAGEPYDITWTSQGIEYVKIQYNPKNSVLSGDWVTIADSVPNNNHYMTAFTIESENAVLRIGEAGSGSNYFYSGVFKIKPAPKVTVLSPNGGDKWLVGNTYKIAWTATNVQNVKIEMTTNGGFSWRTIVGSTPNDGSLDYYRPGIQDSSDNCYVRISDAADGTPSDQSDRNFSVRVADNTKKFIKVVFPNGGEKLRNGALPLFDIVWNSYGVNNVKVEYSLDNGMTWVVLNNNYQSTGLFPAIDMSTLFSGQARVRVSDAADPTVVDESDGTFTINTDSGGN